MVPLSNANHLTRIKMDFGGQIWAEPDLGCFQETCHELLRLGLSKSVRRLPEAATWCHYGGPVFTFLRMVG